LADLSGARVGNDEYAEQNGSFGLTTLRDRHVKVAGSKIRLRFRGKGGRQQILTIEDPKLARIVRRCQDLPGQELFEWVDADGTIHDVTSTDVNDYLNEISGQNFTSKDFRTWIGTVLTAKALRQVTNTNASTSDRRSRLVGAIKIAADKLGNTPAVCRKSYVHPAIIDAYSDPYPKPKRRKIARRKFRRSSTRLSSDEAFVFKILSQQTGGVVRDGSQ
jgi:DNA topoisomerase-1